ncbi:hypothetical protein V1525DRAFT_400097 [Lipomyces kononenkoae]|uniref:Uncharacterized protein n=1 Tax=Lipomyces kononenkoae TaxID=34357 RepID=A0ACC3T4E7_LIPKO
MAADHSGKRKRRDSHGDGILKNESVVHKFIAVLEQEDPAHAVLTTKILHRPPSRLTRSPKRTRTEPSSRPENDSVSILEKFRLGGYQGPDDSSLLSELQADLKAATQSVISKLSPTSDLYALVDKFYIYAESLFAKQVATENPDDVNESDETVDPYEITVRGNDKEVLYMVSQHGPLFSSLSNKSRIDPREFEVPSFFTTTKIVPMRPSTLAARKLGLLSPSPYYAVVGSAPAVTAKIRPLLADFVHPVNEPLPTAKWLRYSPYSSFAPARDEAHVIVSGSTAAAVWYDRYLRRRAALQERSSDEDDDETARPTPAGETPSDAVSTTPAATAAEESQSPPDDTAEVDPAIIQDWLTSEAAKAFDAATLANVTTWLARLQELQHTRFRTPPPSAPLVIPPHVYQNPQQLMQMQLQQVQQQQYFIEGPPVSDEERDLIRKVQAALAEVVAQLPPYLVNDLPSGLIPTLAKSTVGSLPPDNSDLPMVQAPVPQGSSSRRRR